MSIDTRAHTPLCLVIHPYSTRNAPDAGYRLPSAALAEAVGLAEAIEIDVVQAHSLSLRQHTPRTLIGPGQLEQMKTLVDDYAIDVVVVNHSLSPTQQRNLEKALGTKVIDRTALILEIFGARAQTAEGQLQVELAALNYQKSRLVRSWTHLERQRGGFGFMGGPGESQIETDRRLISERILVIKKQLNKVLRTRELHRKTRRDTPYPLVALVGYTNAGKSTLFNRLTNAQVVAEDMLFATLDPTIRRLSLPSGQEILLSDTVGFISQLPHELVAAFRATLEEVMEADVLVHVRDISHEDSGAQKNDVLDVIRDIIGESAAERPMIEVWNKIDMVPDAAALPRVNGGEILLSAMTGDGCTSLIDAIDRALQAKLYVHKRYPLPASDGKALAWLYRHGSVESQSPDPDSDTPVMWVEVSLRPADAARFEREFLS